LVGSGVAMSQTTTPMIRQYRQLKAQAEDCLLFFRLGDFYELFFEDAKVASQICGLTLTSRNKKSTESVPMCGVPYHAAATYVTKLGNAGHKVAICEQTQNPSEAKGLVERKIVRIVTPGMPFDPLILQSEQSSAMAVCTQVENQWGLSVIDATTGDFWYTLPASIEGLKSLLIHASVRECLMASTWATESSNLTDELEKSGCKLDWCDESFFALEEARTRLKSQFGVSHLDAYILPEHQDIGTRVCGAALKYVQLCEPESKLAHLYKCQYISLKNQLLLSPSVIHSLELIRSPNAQVRDLGLASVMDGSRTPMGRRLLRKRLLSPVLDLQEIKRRQEIQSRFCECGPTHQSTFARLSEVGDLERLFSKIALGHASPREVWRLGYGIQTTCDVLKNAAQFDVIQDLVKFSPETAQVAEKILNTIINDPPVTKKEGGFIQPEHHAELKIAAEAEVEFKRWRDHYEKKLKDELNIPSLKVKHSRVVGYTIEVTHAHLSKAPEIFTRKQTLANAERFVTSELKQRENEYVISKNRQIQIEEKIFSELISFITSQREFLFQFFKQLAEVDMTVGLCLIIERQGWSKPLIDDSKKLEIQDMFHPVVKELLQREGKSFVSNTIKTDGDKQPLILISGPNMGGKSTLMRQVALVVILAQAGLYVPAISARLGWVDQVFTRMGASDALTEGKSTFYMEMQETAQFLMQATDRSLVLIDELGRGTSTYDGLSMVWSVCEFLLTRLKGRCFCATHFYQLAKLKETFPDVGLFHVGADEHGGELIFNYKLKPGFTSRSYGIHVARLAGVRPEVLNRAQEILQLFESNKGLGKQTAAKGYDSASNEPHTLIDQKKLF
jgi:DNA mismatch repair protein MutS